MVIWVGGVLGGNRLFGLKELVVCLVVRGWVLVCIGRYGFMVFGR